MKNDKCIVDYSNQPKEYGWEGRTSIKWAGLEVGVANLSPGGGGEDGSKWKGGFLTIKGTKRDHRVDRNFSFSYF